MKSRSEVYCKSHMRIIQSVRIADARYSHHFADLRKHGMYFNFIRSRRGVVLQAYW